MVNKKCCSYDGFPKGTILDYYYQAYYYVERNRAKTPIAAMECQVALMRNLLLPMFMLSFKIQDFVFKDNPVCCLRFAMILLVFFMAFAIIRRQENIYKCVFEDYEYLTSIMN